MTDIKVPISAPGSQQAANDIQKTADALKLTAAELTKYNKIHDESVAHTAKFLAEEKKIADVFRSGISPAIKTSTADLQAFNATLARSRTTSNIRGPGGATVGGSNDDLFGRGGGLAQGAQALGRLGGEARTIFRGLGAAAGALTVGLSVVTVGALAAGFAFRKWEEIAERNTAAAAEGAEASAKFAHSLLEATRSQNDRAKAGFLGVDSSQASIFAHASNPNEARRQIRELGTSENVIAFANLEKTRQGREYKTAGGFDIAMQRADYLIAHGISDTRAGAFAKMQEQKGPFDPARLFNETGSGMPPNAARMKNAALNVAEYRSGGVSGFDNTGNLLKTEDTLGRVRLGQANDSGAVASSQSRELESTAHLQRFMIDKQAELNHVELAGIEAAAKYHADHLSLMHRLIDVVSYTPEQKAQAARDLAGKTLLNASHQ